MRASENELKAWMIGSLDGDAASHSALLIAFVPLLRAFYARRMSDGGGNIEDLVQETLIAVHTRRATYDHQRAFSAWLFSIARDKMIDLFRRSGRLRQLDDLNTTLAAAGFEEASNARIDVDRLLLRLPPKLASAIRETRIDSLRTAEAAHSTGIGESDVKVSVHRGVRALAKRVLGEGA